MALINYTIWTIFILTLSGRPKDHEEYKKLIIGDWTFVKEESKCKLKPDSIDNSSFKVGFKSGYKFIESGLCENKLGYFNHENLSYTQFLGTDTKYRLEDNRLNIFDLEDDTWKGYEILKLDGNILKLALNDSVNMIFERSNYKLTPGIPFDQIIVSSSGCLGSCQVNDVMVSRSGEVIFNNEQYTKERGLFSSLISLKQFDDLEQKFRKANLKKLKDKYEASWTDDNEITISLIKNGRIFRTIIDYGYQAPTELYWAYFSVVFLSQKLSLKNLPNEGNFRFQKTFSFEKNDKFIRLAKSEGFYLANLLNTANLVDRVFIEKYTLHAAVETGSMKTTTDGRYFKIELENGKFLTVDLGYNFLHRNNLLKRLSAKMSYEN